MNYTSLSFDTLELQRNDMLSNYQFLLEPNKVNIESYSDEIPFIILLKFPSRSRPDKLKSTFTSYITMASKPSSLYALVSLDEDDSTVTPQLVNELKQIHANTTVVIGASKGKIGAVNRDMEQAGQFNYDIILLASDDMIPVQEGYDEIIRRDMKTFYPDRDGVLWYNDGYQGSKLNTLCILGKPYYERFKYIYHPSYKSLYCDNEFMEVANQLGKQTYRDNVIIRHEHPITTSHVNRDELYIENQKYVYEDYDNFIKRRAEGFKV
jgi:hypothetical protein